MSYTDLEARFVIDRVTVRCPTSQRKWTTIDTWPVVTPHSPLWLRRIGEQVGLQFNREPHFDFQPYCADDPDDQHVILLKSRYLIGYAVLIAGAIGIHNADIDPYLAWVWVHSYERGCGLVDEMWPDVLRRYPGIRGIHQEDRDPENTPAGNALLDRLSKLGPTAS